MSEVANAAWPSEIKLSADKRTLAITFDNGDSFALPAELLRVMSPSAEVQGHSEAERRTVSGKRHIGIRDVRPIGNYAVQIVFDDGHDTGFYRWQYLHDLGARQAKHWSSYLEELARKGLTRG
jgi:DUF971 family protein